MEKSIILFGILALRFLCIISAFGTVQDFCVADFTKPATGYGQPCKSPTEVTADDFFFSGLQIPGNTTNTYGAAINPVVVSTMPGLNTLGMAMARLDFGPKGLNPPHSHPRATEMITVLKGSLRIGFVTSNPTTTHIMKLLKKGDVFAIPKGLVHYQFNPGNGNTVAITALSSESPGIIDIPQKIFGARPDWDDTYLAKSFGLDKKIVDDILARF